MIGQSTASLESGARRWLRRCWGQVDVHARQKWRVLWPRLAPLGKPGARVLDAGCGDGLWSLEMAGLRPEWQVTGIDRDESAIALAERRRAALGPANVQFCATDFRAFTPRAAFDILLSVASAHYMIAGGEGRELFGRFRSWAAPGGHLILLCGRPEPEVPYAGWLPRPQLSEGVDRRELIALAEGEGWEVSDWAPVIGKWGTVAKQLAVAGQRGRLWRGALYPLVYGFDWGDQWLGSRRGASSFQVLVARRRA